VLSDAYARASRGAVGPEDDPALPERLFARAAVRPLSADQLFRSLLLATGIEQAGRGRFREQIEDGKARALREYLFVFGDDEGDERDTFRGSVTQALLLWNGELTNLGTLAFEGSVLAEILAASDDAGARLEAMYFAAYARPPSDAERARWLAWLAERQDARKAYEDLYFAMLTSTEFTTNH
jgi:hypothetical protein